MSDDIVSGGALGIDGAAHRGALAAQGTTTVVLGNGLDIAYPARHAPLFREVVARGGGLAGLCADGVTTIDHAYHLDRGYPGFVADLCRLGADVRREAQPPADD